MGRFFKLPIGTLVLLGCLASALLAQNKAPTAAPETPIRVKVVVMALGLDPRFDLTKAYWVIAGIGGSDPADVSLGSVVWANHVIDGDIGYEIDAREIPADWPTGFGLCARQHPTSSR